jgi:hypothetical protein
MDHIGARPTTAPLGRNSLRLGFPFSSLSWGLLVFVDQLEAALQKLQPKLALSLWPRVAGFRQSRQ